MSGTAKVGGPSEIDLCIHCQGNCDCLHPCRNQQDCPKHGIAASNQRQSDFLRDYDKSR